MRNSWTGHVAGTSENDEMSVLTGFGSAGMIVGVNDCQGHKDEALPEVPEIDHYYHRITKLINQSGSFLIT